LLLAGFNACLRLKGDPPYYFLYQSHINTPQDKIYLYNLEVERSLSAIHA
jgi:hypothetical protein